MKTTVDIAHTRRAHLTCLIIAALGLTNAGKAIAAKNRFDGTWTGLLETGGVRLRLELVIAGKDITLVSLDQGSARFRANDVAITGERIAAWFKAVGAHFEGSLNGDQYIDGVFTQEQAIRVRFTRSKTVDVSSEAKPTGDNTIISTPKLNQVGFTPAAAKQFAMTVRSHDPLKYFEVLNERGEVVFEGKFAESIFDLRNTAGEFCVCGDFSSLMRAGRYRVRAGGEISHPFVIGDGVYNDLLRDAARSFYLIQANVDIDDPITGVKHKAGHTSDLALTVDGQKRDLSGGWYNAGDFGKFTHMHAISVSHMLRLYELRPTVTKLILNTPAKYDGMPDLLQTARWGLEWLLRMQNADGSVLHKVDSQPLLTWGRLPVNDTNPRVAMAASSIDAGVFTGVMGHASRIFAPFDALFAERCRSAAFSAWHWLSRHPDVSHTDAYYLDPDSSQEIAWAKCEISILQGMANRMTMPLKNYVTPFYWPSPQVLGYMSLALSGNDHAKAMIITGANQISTRTLEDAYGFSAAADDYVWGSNERALNDAAICLYSHHLAPDLEIRTGAQRLFDYILGRNSLGHSFVTGHGIQSTRNPFHWIYETQHIAIPGWASGGSNSVATGADALLKAVIERGAPPAKCFVDACQSEGSFASNEGETSENAALIFVAGMLG